MRGLIGAAYTPVEVAELRQWLVEDTVPGGPVLDPELRWQLLARLCVLGAAGAEDIEAELVRDPSATGEQGAAHCRAALPDEAAKEAAWQLLFHSDASNHIVAAAARGLWQPEQAELLGDRPLRYFAEVVATAARRGPALARVLGSMAFPVYAAEPRTLSAAEECLGRDDLTAAIRRALADQVDDLRRALRVREAAK